MCTIINYLKWLKTVVFLLLISSVFAGGENYSIGARQAAMGNTGVGLNDVWSTHHNQAGLAFIKTPSVGISGETRFMIKENSVKAIVVAIPLKSGTFGLNVTSFGFSNYNETKVGIAFAKTFGDNFAAGVQMDYLTVGLGENYGRIHAFSVEAGIQAQINDKLAVGAHIFNPNRAKMATYNDERIPTILRVGINYEFSKKVMVAVEVEKDIEFNPIIKSGLEYHITDPLYLRMGISSNPFQSSFGFGILMKNFNIDFSASYHSILGYSPQVSLSYRL
jgi:hypothetical protein